MGNELLCLVQQLFLGPMNRGRDNCQIDVFFPLLICRVCTGKGGMGSKLAITVWFAALS